MATRSSRTLILFAALALLGAIGAPAQADDQYPSRPVRIVVSFSAGGPTDIVGRVIAQKLSELFGQQFFVENKVGAGGNIGADQVAKSPPDGYTLLVATVSTHAINPGLYSKMPYDPVKDFAPIAQVGVTPTMLGVHPSIPAKDIKSLIALIKERRCTLPDALALVTRNPAAALKLVRKGRLAPGMDADLLVLERDSFRI